LKLLRKKYEQILKVKDHARSKNVSWFQVVWFTVPAILFISVPMNFGIIIGVGWFSTEFHLEHNWLLWGIMDWLVPIQLTVSVWFLVIPLMRFNVWILERINKATGKAIVWSINKLDMYWFRKYRTHSPVTRLLDKVQTKTAEKKSKWSKKKKRAIKIGLIVGLILLQIWLRLPMMEEIYDDTVNNLDELEAKELEQDAGKIKSPLSQNPLVNEP